MRVALFGGSGFIGQYLAGELVNQGHCPILFVRPGSQSKIPDTTGMELVPGTFSDPPPVAQAIAGAAAVIYSIGLIREYPRRGITFQQAHFDYARMVIDAARQNGVGRFILISANGVRPEGTAYQCTKYAAEEYLRNSGLDWTIFRPSVVFGDPKGQMELATQLYRQLVKPWIPVPLFFDGLNLGQAGRFEISPVHVIDLSAAVVKALGMVETAGQTYAVGGPETLTWETMIKRIAAAGGRRKRYLPVPVGPVKIVARILGRWSWFPLAADQITMLLEGNVCPPENLSQVFGIEPKQFDSEQLIYLRDLFF